MDSSHALAQPVRRERKDRFSPLALLLKVLAVYAPGILPRVQKSVFRTWYQYMSAPGAPAEVTTLNYGYAPLAEQTGVVVPDDEDDRYSLALYHRVAAAVDLRGKDVLEIGCGRGGGAAYIKRRFEPSRMVGIDLAENAVAFCRRQHGREGLYFLAGDAEQLPLATASFDAVANVESSHCYPQFDRFLQEVKRVLRPGGHFLFTDFRGQKDVAALRRQLHASGLLLVEEERITDNVVAALDRDTERRLALTQRHAPGPLRNVVKEVAGVRGSQIYEELRSARTEYLRFVLQKA